MVPPFIFMTPEEAKKTDETFRRWFNAAATGARKALNILALRHHRPVDEKPKSKLENT